MLSNGTSFLLDGYWWEIYPAGLMILLTVIAFNFIGDGLRDSFEVRLQAALSRGPGAGEVGPSSNSTLSA